MAEPAASCHRLTKHHNTSLTRNAKPPRNGIRNGIRKAAVIVTTVVILLFSAYYIHAISIHFKWAQLMLTFQRKPATDDHSRLIIRQAFGQAITVVACTYLPFSLVSPSLASCGTYRRLPPIDLVQAFNETAQISRDVVSFLRHDGSYRPGFIGQERIRFIFLQDEIYKVPDFKDEASIYNLLRRYENIYGFVSNTNENITTQARIVMDAIKADLYHPTVLDQCSGTSTEVLPTAFGDSTMSPLLEMTEDFAQHLTNMDRFCSSWKRFLQRQIDNIDHVLETGRVAGAEHDTFIREHLMARHPPPQAAFSWDYVNWLLRKTFDSKSIKAENARHEKFVSEVRTALADAGRLEEFSEALHDSVERYESVCQKPKEMWTRFERGDYVGSLTIPCERCRKVFGLHVFPKMY